MHRQLVAHAHPVDGHFEINQNGDRITVICRWPFDLETDEWIDIENEFDASTYSSAVADAIATGRGEARGLTGGSILLENSPGDRHTVVVISNSSAGWAAKSLRLSVPRPLTDFVGSGDVESDV
jgi:hypothetical protein